MCDRGRCVCHTQLNFLIKTKLIYSKMKKCDKRNVPLSYLWFDSSIAFLLRFVRLDNCKCVSNIYSV